MGLVSDTLSDNERIGKLEALYARIPEMKTCSGKCENSCTVVPTTAFERLRLEKALGYEFGSDKNPDGKFRCVALKDGKCSVYSTRPLLCRMFGTSKHPFLKCEFGCEPERWVSGDETVELMLGIMELCGEMDNPVNPYLEPMDENTLAMAAKMLLKTEGS